MIFCEFTHKVNHIDHVLRACLALGQGRREISMRFPQQDWTMSLMKAADWSMVIWFMFRTMV